MDKSKLTYKVTLRAGAIPVLLVINFIPYLLKRKMIFPKWLIKFEKV